jgi:hypothetical protein
VKTKILETVYCWEELFRPHEDLLPLFFQFYAGILRNGFDIPHDYKSVFRPEQLKVYKKPEVNQPRASEGKSGASSKPAPAPTASEKKTFEEIREELILTNVPGGSDRKSSTMLTPRTLSRTTGCCLR